MDKLGVDTKALEELLIPSLEKALEEADIIVIDELGKIENATKNIKNEIEKVMKSEKEIIITLHKNQEIPCYRSSGHMRASGSLI